MFNKIADELDISDLPEFDQKRQAPGMVTTLKPHQLVGVAWMLSRETQSSSTLPPFFKQRTLQSGLVRYYNSVTSSSSPKRPNVVLGGLVADDMGLGKTIQCITLMVANPRKSPTDPRPTLIVSPLSVIENWRSQIAEHASKARLRVIIWHGMLYPRFISMARI